MQINDDEPFQIPSSLRDKLLSFRRRVWCLKLLEAFAAAAIGVLLGFLLTYALDRFIDTPRWLRGVILLSAVVCCAAIPVALERWVWRRRRIDQLARLLAQTYPSAGDQLLGVIHLSEDAAEQARSPELVRAAIRQAAANVAAQDFASAIPHQRHRRRGLFAALLGCASLFLMVLTAAAATSAWARFLNPWGDTPRYTFASIEPLPDSLFVPHGEPFELSIALDRSSRWKPEAARVHLSGHRTEQASLSENRYDFTLPGQISPLALGLRVGDYRGQLRVEPVLRPELESLRAEIRLPDYLGRPESLAREIRGTTLSAVQGSRVELTATATRPLQQAFVDGRPRSPEQERFRTEPLLIAQPTVIELKWRDEYGLSGKDSLKITIDALDDEPPSLILENLPRRKVLLDNEVLTFQVRAHDDFGVKRVGIEWQAVVEGSPGETLGESILGAGDAHAETLELAAAFSAGEHGIEPQTIALRVFVEDFYPDRERVYSPPSLLEILDRSQHAIWVASELSRWHRMSLDVRDREMQLHETNKSLRELSQEELAEPETRQQLAQQAEQEQANARRLANLVRSGESLLREAMRNSELGAENLEQWAETVQVLKDIAENRMPSVAELLKEASQAPSSSAAQNDPESKTPQVGQNRLEATAASDSGDPAEPAATPPPVPSISDIESTQHDLNALQPEQPEEQSSPSQGRLTLPDTKLAGDAKSEGGTPAADPQLEQAVVEQEGLLEEFEKVAGELSDILANLEGSTLVKRLKAASRKQQQVAAGLASLVTDAFGVPDREKTADSATFSQLAEIEARSSQDVSHIMDDMTAFFQRNRYALFQHVLDDMKARDVTASLRTLSEQLRAENGLSIAQAEYWSDTFDRWAEDLVEVTQSGSSPGGKAKGSLPPGIVLEVLQLLDGEVNLREQTRVAEQARPAVSDTQHMETANRLADIQDGFQQRVDELVDQILELPDAEGDFANELSMLSDVSAVMKETVEILYKPDTGPPAIAAQTEIIELLLKSKRFNPNASGGSGADPGGGGSGTTETPALALVGSGVNAREVRQELSSVPATGTSGVSLPEEFRSGLDAYFHRLENWKSK